MNFSTEIKDSTLRETSCTNHVHYLEVGNYMPILHPTANTSLPGTDVRMNKIFIAAYDYAEGDVYSIFGQELSLVNRDLKIYTGDYVKATIDFSDNSIKLVNISRVTYTPNTELGDVDYTYDVVIGSSRVTIHEQKIYLTENTDISINTTAYDISGIYDGDREAFHQYLLSNYEKLNRNDDIYDFYFTYK